MDSMYTRAEVEYMLKRACEQVYDVVFRLGYISHEDRDRIIQRLLEKRR